LVVLIFSGFFDDLNEEIKGIKLKMPPREVISRGGIEWLRA